MIAIETLFLNQIILGNVRFVDVPKKLQPSIKQALIDLNLWDSFIEDAVRFE